MKQWLAVACVLALGTGMILAEKKTLTVQLKPLEGKGVSVYFNPKELSIDKSVPWQKSKSSEPDREPVLVFEGTESTTLTFETAFDTTGTDESVYRKYIELLENLAKVDAEKKRPPKVLVIWGEGAGAGLPKFEGVIESVSAKYTMFSESGTPVRATASISMKSASGAKTREEEDEPCTNEQKDCP